MSLQWFKESLVSAKLDEFKVFPPLFDLVFVFVQDWSPSNWLVRLARAELKPGALDKRDTRVSSCKLGLKAELPNSIPYFSEQNVSKSMIFQYALLFIHILNSFWSV